MGDVRTELKESDDYPRSRKDLNHNCLISKPVHAPIFPHIFSGRWFVQVALHQEGEFWPSASFSPSPVYLANSHHIAEADNQGSPFRTADPVTIYDGDQHTHSNEQIQLKVGSPNWKQEALQLQQRSPKAQAIPRGSLEDSSVVSMCAQTW